MATLLPLGYIICSCMVPTTSLLVLLLRRAMTARPRRQAFIFGRLIAFSFFHFSCLQRRTLFQAIGQLASTMATNNYTTTQSAPTMPVKDEPQVIVDLSALSAEDLKSLETQDPFLYQSIGAQEGTGSRGCRPLERRSLELLRSRLEANGLIEPFKRRRG